MENKFKLSHLALYAKGWYNRSDNIWEDLKKILCLDGYTPFTNGDVYSIILGKVQECPSYRWTELREVLIGIHPNNCWKFGYYVKNNSFWSVLFMTSGNYQVLKYKKYPELLNKLTTKEKEIIKNTEFSIDELARIEYTFETNTHISFFNYIDHSKEEIKQDQLKGLTAVVNLLLEMDKDIETDIEEVFVSKVKDLQLV